MPVLIRGIFSGGGKIKDATALPEDVASGKVFYNNDGRQVGNGEIIKKYTFPLARGTKTDQYDYVCLYDGTEFFMQKADSISHTVSNTTVSIPDIKGICGFEYNNKFYPCSIPLRYYYSETAAVYADESDYNSLVFMVCDKKFTLGSPLKTRELILYYI